MTVNIYIPTLNAGDKWPQAVAALRRQRYPINRVVIVDSGSTDHTLSAEYVHGFEVIHIDKRDFDHGGTRHLAVQAYPDADIYLFITQDAILGDEEAVSNLVKAFADNEKVGVAYGRQLPHDHAKTLEAHARLFNYPARSEIRSLADAPRYGIKTVSCSNSFAAYRRTAYEAIGGFPSGTILGEDVVASSRMLLDGWVLAYVAEASAQHSHDYTVREEFKRYFDIGVFHINDEWILKAFGKADGQGLKYLSSELKYVLRHNPLVLPKSIATLFAKWSGYKLGLNYRSLPRSWRRRLSMHKAYWDRTVST